MKLDEVDNLSIEELTKLVQDLKESKETGWTFSGVSPLRVQLKVVRRLLELSRETLQKEHLAKVQTLAKFTRNQSTTRVRKNVNRK